MTTGDDNAATTFDFIIVGAGTSGSLLASRLASSLARPSVLLLETGPNTLHDHRYRASFDRFMIHVSGEPEIGRNYDCKLVGDRDFSYARGKGMGGTSQNNFSCWSTGPADDYDLWADLVGDDVWRWESAKMLYNKIVTLHTDHCSAETRRFASPDANVHASDHGDFDLEYPHECEPGTEAVMKAADDFGWGRNLDINSGNPLGLGLFANAFRNGLRVTSASAFLRSPPPNLKIWTGVEVVKVKFIGFGARGIELADGRICQANKEVLLCAGAIDTPRLLMLSGIGPKDVLDQAGISVVKALSGVGKSLGDHLLGQVVFEAKPNTNEKMRYFCDVAGQAAARDDWTTERLEIDGPYRTFNDSTMAGFFKHSKDQNLDDLDEVMRKHVQKSTVPHFEMCLGPILPFPEFTMNPEITLYNLAIVLQNPQSRGSVTVTSSDPGVRPSINFNMLSHPYDKQNCIDSVRQILQFARSPTMQQVIVKELFVPKSDDDEDILDFVKGSCGPVWHANGTMKMGRSGSADTCVTRDFKVKGLDRVRVVDTSVMPFTMSNHTMSIALLIAQVAAEKIIGEHGLDA